MKRRIIDIDLVYTYILKIAIYYLAAMLLEVSRQRSGIQKQVIETME